MTKVIWTVVILTGPPQ